MKIAATVGFTTDARRVRRVHDGCTTGATWKKAIYIKWLRGYDGYDAFSEGFMHECVTVCAAQQSTGIHARTFEKPVVSVVPVERL
jgi:hypothetical protein